MAGGKKQSKNNPDLKTKKTEYKIYDSQHCEKCAEHENCKEYNDYLNKLMTKGKGHGCICKYGK